MAVKIFPVFIILLMFSSGAAIYNQAFREKINLKYSRDVTRRKLKSFLRKIKSELSDDELDAMLKQAGISISQLTYKLVRYIILILWLIEIVRAKLNSGSDVRVLLVIWVISLVVSKPCKSILNLRSPFKLTCDKLSRKVKTKLNLELYKCFSQLKNIALSMSDKALSSDYIIREITRYAKATKPHFQRLSIFWYEGRYAEGKQYFSNAIGTESAKSLVNLLEKFDYITPENFISQIELFQKQLIEQRKTAVKEAQEAQGDVVFGIAIASGFILCLNFLAVVVGIDVISMLQNLSF